MLALLVVIGAISDPVLGRLVRAGQPAERRRLAARRLGAGAARRDAVWPDPRLSLRAKGQPLPNRHAGRTQHARRRDRPSDDAEDADACRDPSDILRLREDRLPDGIVIFAAGDVAASNQVAATAGRRLNGELVAPDPVSSRWHDLRRLPPPDQR